MIVLLGIVVALAVVVVRYYRQELRNALVSQRRCDELAEQSRLDLATDQFWWYSKNVDAIRRITERKCG